MARLSSFPGQMFPRALAVSMLILLLLACSGCTHVYFLALNGSAGKAIASTVHPVPGQSLAMDIYRPTVGAERAPVLVFFYGGRWQGGKRQDYAFVGKRLAEQGVVVMIPDYRLYPEVRFPTFVEDAAAASAWAKKHAADYGGDPNRVFLAGHSAGAHMVALLGTDARYFEALNLEPRDFAGIIGLAGPYDFLPLTDDDLVDIFSNDPATQRASQPVNFANGDEPPFLLLHGGSDLLVWPLNSEHLKAKLEAAGSKVRYVEYPGVGHIRILAAMRYAGLAPAQHDILQFVSAPQRAAKQTVKTSPDMRAGGLQASE